MKSKDDATRSKNIVGQHIVLLGFTLVKFPKTNFEKCKILVFVINLVDVLIYWQFYSIYSRSIIN